MGAAAASLLVPGVGPVIAAGLIGAALLGLGGAATGALAGDKIEDAMDEGLPHDELYVYEDALRRGHTVVIAFAEDDEQARSGAHGSGAGRGGEPRRGARRLVGRLARRRRREIRGRGRRLSRGRSGFPPRLRVIAASESAWPRATRKRKPPCESVTATSARWKPSGAATRAAAPIKASCRRNTRVDRNRLRLCAAGSDTRRERGYHQLVHDQDVSSLRQLRHAQRQAPRAVPRL